MVWYDVKPYELFEVHRSGIVLSLPRHDLLGYVEPYWEGWVKSLRVIYKPAGSVFKGMEDAKAQSKGKHHDKGDMDAKIGAETEASPGSAA